MFLKIGHRGAMGYEPENTILSFAKAVELKADMIELDVVQCATGEIMVIHDHQLERVTNGTGYVWEKSFDELRTLDAGKGQKIPTLEEVLDFIDKRVKVNIELKGENLSRPVNDVIVEYIGKKGWGYEDLFISSFNHYELKDMRSINQNIKICPLIAGIPLGYAGFAEPLKSYSVNLSCDFINKKYIDDAHSRNMKVFVWVVNDHREIKRIKALGVDGIFSNFPDRL